MPSRTITNSAAEFLLRNRHRRSFLIQNEDATIDVFIKQERAGALTVSSTDHDHRLAAGNSLALEFGIDGIEAVQDRWTIIAASGTPLISFIETEEIIR